MQNLVDDELWPLWRRLVRALPAWRMPLEWVFSASIWSLAGVDFVSGLLKNRNTTAVFAILQPLAPELQQRLHAIALLNHRRHEAISRWMAIAFVTVPASAALTLSELSPETMRTIAGFEGATRWYLLFAYIGAVVGLYLLWAWRARQLLTVIELWLIQSGAPPRDPVDAGETPLEAPLGA